MKARDLGVELVLERQTDYRNRVEAVIEFFASDGQEFDSDLVRALVGETPRGCSPNVIGACFIAASRRKLIRATGYTHSVRVAGHHNLIRSWVGVRG
jgi:hypothetical protein